MEVEVEVVNEQVESGPGYRSEDSQREEVWEGRVNSGIFIGRSNKISCHDSSVYMTVEDYVLADPDLEKLRGTGVQVVEEGVKC